jgi:hypothetical protein
MKRAPALALAALVATALGLWALRTPAVPDSRTHVATAPSPLPPRESRAGAPRVVAAAPTAAPDGGGAPVAAPSAPTASGTYPSLPIPAKLPYVEGAADDEVTEPGVAPQGAPVPVRSVLKSAAPAALSSDPPRARRSNAEGADDDEGSD